MLFHPRCSLRKTGEQATDSPRRPLESLVFSYVYFLLPQAYFLSLTLFHGRQAPVIALYANLQTAVPVYVSGALIIGSGALALFLPYEPRGKASI